MTETQELNDRLGDLVGQSAPMQKVFARLRKAARCEVPVVLFGPTGSGKQLAARTIHDLSRRKEGPFIPVTTTAPHLCRRLFGEEGSAPSNPGLVSVAHGGTLYIDEVANLNHGHQVALLRILEAESPMGPSIRLMAATRHDPEALHASGCIREDFHYRTHIIPVRMPPLSERREDIPLLVSALSQRLGLRPLSPEGHHRLARHPLPGHVAELAEVIQRIATEDAEAPLPEEDATLSQLSLKEAMNAFERAIIARTLQKAHGDLTRTASLLGLHRRTLAHKIQSHGLDLDIAPWRKTPHAPKR